MLYTPRGISARRLQALMSFLSRTVLMALLIVLGSTLRAQNTEATVLGTVKDPSGSVVAGATVELSNQGTGASRSATTDSNGDYRFSGVEIGSYILKIDANGFQKEEFSKFDLLARESRRLDITLKIGTQAQSVDVQAADVPDVQTDTSNIGETKTGRELVDIACPFKFNATRQVSRQGRIDITIGQYNSASLKCGHYIALVHLGNISGVEKTEQPGIG